MRKPMQSDVFFFGPGEWRLGHDPQTQHTLTTRMCFGLVYLGQRDGTSAKKETETNDSISTFSLFAELSLIASDGRPFASAGKSFYQFD